MPPLYMYEANHMGNMYVIKSHLIMVTVYTYKTFYGDSDQTGSFQHFQTKQRLTC